VILLFNLFLKNYLCNNFINFFVCINYNMKNNSGAGSILKTIIILIIIFGIGYFIYHLYNKNIQTNTDSGENMPMNMKENMTTNDMEEEHSSHMMHSEDAEHQDSEMENMQNVNEHFTQGENSMDYYSMDKKFENQRNETNFPKEQLTAEELLPSDNSTLWAQVNPAGEGSLKDRNFLQSGYHIGINTVGQTLRNANQQLRSEPPNPQVKVSPWLQSTIEPDVGRKPMEIGGCA